MLKFLSSTLLSFVLYLYFIKENCLCNVCFQAQWCLSSKSLLLHCCCRTAATQAPHAAAAAPTLTSLIQQLMAEWKRSIAWSYFRAVKENVANSGGRGKTVCCCCGNTSNLFKHKKTRKKQLWATTGKMRRDEPQHPEPKEYNTEEKDLQKVFKGATLEVSTHKEGKLIF